MLSTTEQTGYRRCGCCGREFPARKVTELGTTPGVYICAFCALWAARRAHPFRSLPRPSALPRLGRSLLQLARRPRPGETARLAVPILPAADQDRTVAFYALLGFAEAARYEGYLVLHSGPVELHFSDDPGPGGQCYVHVPHALKLWKQLRHGGVQGVGEIADQSYGLREFTVTDPDGNRVRVGSPMP